MRNRFGFLKKFYHSLRKYLHARWIRVGGAVGIGLLLLQLLFEEQVVTLARWVWPRITGLAQQEVGIVGLVALAVLLATVITVVILAYMDSRPKPVVHVEPILTKEERELIQPIRVVWNLFGNRTTYALLTLLDDVVYPLKNQRYWGILIQPLLEDLCAARESMTAAVDYDSTVSFSGVCDTFNDTYNAYAQAMRWLAEIDAAGDILVAEEAQYPERLTEWQDLHFSFTEELARVNQHPALHRRLRISTTNMAIMHEPFNRMMRDIMLRGQRRIPPRAHIEGSID